MTERELKRITDIIDKLDDKLDSIDKTLIIQAAQLKEHIRRTEINEEAIELLRRDVAPIKSHVRTIGTIFKWSTVVLSLVATSASIVFTVYKLTGN